MLDQPAYTNRSRLETRDARSFEGGWEGYGDGRSTVGGPTHRSSYQPDTSRTGNDSYYSHQAPARGYSTRGGVSFGKNDEVSYAPYDSESRSPGTTHRSGLTSGRYASDAQTEYTESDYPRTHRSGYTTGADTSRTARTGFDSLYSHMPAADQPKRVTHIAGGAIKLRGMHDLSGDAGGLFEREENMMGLPPTLMAHKDRERLNTQGRADRIRSYQRLADPSLDPHRDHRGGMEEGVSGVPHGKINSWTDLIRPGGHVKDPFAVLPGNRKEKPLYDRNDPL